MTDQGEVEIIVTSIPAGNGVTIECSVCGPLTVIVDSPTVDAVADADLFCQAHLAWHGVKTITYG